MKITIETTVSAPAKLVWMAWTSPLDIMHWNAASNDWCCPAAKNDLRVGGGFCYRMESRDGLAGFDFAGTYTRIDPQRRIEFILSDTLGDARTVVVEFLPVEEGTIVRETFDTEDVHTAEQQRHGWHSILKRFKKYVESSG